jgi:hypothetical protein
MRIPEPTREALILKLNDSDRSSDQHIVSGREAVERAEALLNEACKRAQNGEAVVQEQSMGTWLLRGVLS